MKYPWNIYVLFLLISPLGVYAVDDTTIDSSLQRNLDTMIQDVQRSKEVVGFDVQLNNNGIWYDNAVTLNHCKELFNAIQNKQVNIPNPIMSSANGNSENYYNKVSEIIYRYGVESKEGVEIKGDSDKDYDDEINLLLNKDFYKEYSLLSLRRDQRQSDEKPYQITRALYQSSVDEKNNPRYLEIILSRLPNDDSLKKMSVNVLSMDGRLGENMTTSLHFMHTSWFGLFSFQEKTYIWDLTVNPDVGDSEWIHRWTRESMQIMGPNINDLSHYIEKTEWSFSLTIASPIGLDDQAYCQYYLKGRK